MTVVRPSWANALALLRRERSWQKKSRIASLGRRPPLIMTDTTRIDRRLLLIAAGLAITVAIAGWQAGGELGAARATRWTARLSLILFLGALSATTLARRFDLWPGERAWFAALAASHAVHAIAIGVLAAETNGVTLDDRGLVVIAGGGLAYVLIALFVFWPRRPAWVSAIGISYIWVIFFASYLGRVTEGMPIYSLALVALIGALIVRIFARNREVSAN